MTAERPPIATAVQRWTVAPARSEAQALRARVDDLRAVRPLPAHPVAGGDRFLHGFTLPLLFLRRALAVPELRAPLLRLFGARVAFVAAFVTVGFVAQGKAATERADLRIDRHGVHIEGRTEDVQRAVADLRAHAERERSEGDRVEAAVARAAAEELAAEAERARTPPSPPSRWTRWKGTLATLLALFGAAEWIAIAFSRDFDDRLSYGLSVDGGVLPEGPRVAARLRFSPSWLWKKYKRKFRGFLLIALGAVPVSLGVALGRVPGVANVVLAVWGFYWSAVFAASKSAHAWADDGAATLPWFLRPFDPAPKGLLFLPVRGYLRLAHRVAGSVFSPCAAFERSPWAFAGLATFRVLLAPPLVYLLFRPILPVVAGRILADNCPAGRFFPKPAAADDAPAARDGAEPLRSAPAA